LCGGKAAFVDAIVQRIKNPIIQGVDFGSFFCWIEIARSRTRIIKG